MYVFTQQETLDLASIALHKAFGFGPERLKRFMKVFAETFDEDIGNHRFEMRYDSDGNHDYATEKLEDGMKEAWGDAYEPREKRYECDYVIEAPDKPVIDN